jgi:hypothetical protein
LEGQSDLADENMMAKGSIFPDIVSYRARSDFFWTNIKHKKTHFMQLLTTESGNKRFGKNCIPFRENPTPPRAIFFSKYHETPKISI